MSRFAPLVFLLAGLALAAVCWHDLRQLQAVTPSGEAAPTPPEGLAYADPDIAPFALLREWPLFGSVQAAPGAPSPQGAHPSELPLANAPYRLFGIIASDGSSPRRAILGPDENSQRSYREGDSAPDGALIVSIQARGVILRRDGQSSRLELPVDFASTADSTESAPLPGSTMPATDVPEPAAAPEPPQPPLAPAGRAVESSPIARIRKRIEDARAAAARGEGEPPVFEPPPQ